MTEQPPAQEDEPARGVETCGVGPSPLRRLTRREYNNAVRDLLGDTHAPANAFPLEEEVLGFDNNASAQGINPSLVEGYLLAAEAVADRATQDVAHLLSCDVAVGGEDGCVRRFVEAFGVRAFRKPLVQSEVEELLTVYAGARTRADMRGALSQLLQVMLLSPEFLYRLEVGLPVVGQVDVRQLNGYEVASRLASFLWGSVPNDDLLMAAAAGALDTAQGVEAAARRMLADPRTRETVQTFHAQWLVLNRINELAKDPVIYPGFSPDLRAHLRAEVDAFIEHVVWEDGGALRTLLVAPYTFLDAPLAAFYGLPLPAGEGLMKVTLPAGRAAGLLSQGGLLAVLSKPNATSPTQRGRFVREQLLCQHIPPPPDNVVVSIEVPNPTLTARERLAQRSRDVACAGCHTVMDPIGFGFERFDGVGRYRETETNGQPVDDTGEVSGSDMGVFRGVPQLAARLAESPAVHRCVTRHWFRFAQGRGEAREDACTLRFIEEAFAKSGGKIPELLVALTQTKAFRFRSTPIGVQGGTP